MRTEFHPRVHCADHGENPGVCFACWCWALRELHRERCLADRLAKELEDEDQFAPALAVWRASRPPGPD